MHLISSNTFGNWFQLLSTMNEGLKWEEGKQVFSPHSGVTQLTEARPSVFREGQCSTPSIVRESNTGPFLLKAALHH